MNTGARDVMAMPIFPPELFAIIIDHLDVPTLVRCRGVCKILRSLIDDSPSFQYKIELAVAGMDDGPPSDLDPIERLRMLKAHQTAWNQLSWKEFHVPRTAALSRWSFAGSVLALGHHTENAPDFVVTLTQLPSVLRGIEEKTWTIAIRGIRSVCRFEVDPSQDLIVLLNIVPHEDGDTYRHVLPHMLSTGERHPLSAGVLTCLDAYVSSHPQSYRMQIIDNMVGVQCTSTGHLTIWDWKTGELRMDIRGSRKIFSFLTNDLVIIGVTTSLTLNIYDLRCPSNERGTPSEISPLCTFEISPLNGSEAFLNGILTDLSSGKTSPFTLNAPFHTSRNDRLYAFQFWDHNRQPPKFVVFARLSTFMKHIDGLRAGEAGRSFSWEEWGNKDTHILESDGLLAVRCIHGMKFSIVNPNTSQIEVYDFNRLSFKRGVSSGTAHPPRPSATTFMQPIYSSLSYRVRSVPVLNTKCIVMMTEDSLIPFGYPNVPPYFPILSF